MAEPDRARPRRQGWIALAIGVAAIAVGVTFALRVGEPRLAPVTLTAGYLDTSRARVARALVDAAAERGLEVRLVETGETEAELRRVDKGALDFALVSGAYRVGDFPSLREVTPLHVEALHLIVRSEIAAAAGGRRHVLAGRTTYLGEAGSTGAGLAMAALAFRGLHPTVRAGDGGYIPVEIAHAELAARVRRGDLEGLPEVAFVLTTVPAEGVRVLVRSGRYTLIPMPFGEAFRLDSLLAVDAAGQSGPAIARDAVVDTVIPAYTYSTDPPVPEEALPTFGTRLLLVASERVSAAAVERLLEAIFESRFARVAHPPLAPALMQAPPRLPRHAGARLYLARDEPVITNARLGRVNSVLGVLGPLAGGALFLWQWLRQRARSRLEERFGSYLRRVAEIERRMAAHELGAELELEPIAALRRELLELKREMLDRFAAGELGDPALISVLLTPMNAARDQLSDLLLHVREQVEHRADAEGRSSASVWSEEMQGDAPADVGPRREPQRE